MKNINDKFLEMLMSLSPVEVIGLARILDIKVYARDGADIISDIITAYCDLPRGHRRALLRSALRAKEKQNAERSY